MLANTNTIQNTYDGDQRLEVYENNLDPDNNLFVFEPIPETIETGNNNGGLTIATGFNTNQGNNNNMLGRVRNRGGVDINGNIIKSGKHNEYTPDNMIKKCKTMIIKEIFNSVNEKIVQKEGTKPGILKNTLMKMNQKQIVKCTVNDNKSFLYKTIGEILSEDISRGNFPKKHNKIIIENKTLQNQINKLTIENNTYNLKLNDLNIKYQEQKKLILEKEKELNYLKEASKAILEKHKKLAEESNQQINPNLKQ